MVNELKYTKAYVKWFKKLNDIVGKRLIASHINNLRCGKQCDTKHIDGSVYELRIHYGPAYRVYYQQKGNKIIILLLGGNKTSQPHDIERAKELAKNED